MDTIPFSISCWEREENEQEEGERARIPSRRGSRRPTGRERRGEEEVAGVELGEEKKRRSGRAETRERWGRERERRVPAFP